MTRAPMTRFATWMAAVPTPLDADRTSTVSQGWSLARRSNMFQQGMNAVGMAAASTYEMEVGMGTALTAGTLTNSA